MNEDKARDTLVDAMPEEFEYYIKHELNSYFAIAIVKEFERLYYGDDIDDKKEMLDLPAGFHDKFSEGAIKHCRSVDRIPMGIWIK